MKKYTFSVTFETKQNISQAELGDMEIRLQTDIEQTLRDDNPEVENVLVLPLEQVL